jgi:hypothetical protein
MRRLASIGVLAAACGILYPNRAAAQQSVNVFVGGFLPLGPDSRGGGRFSDDVLENNLDFLSFRVRDFDGATFGAEFLAGLGDFFDLGLGAGYYSQTVHSSYTGFEDEAGQDIEQDLRLRIAPFTATIRFLPLGRHTAVKPYVGGGVGICAWDYTESGDFINGDLIIERGTFNGSGAAAGPVVFGGLQIPIGLIGVGGEVRYQHATGELPSNQGFAGSTIDLSGWTWLATVNFRF